MSIQYRRIGDPFPLQPNTCASCGFLAATSDGISYRSVGESVRVEGGFGDDEERVVCAERQIDIPFMIRFRSISEHAELEAIDPENVGNEFAARIAALRGLIREDRGEESERPCHNWASWNPLLSPREHREMVDRQYIVDSENRRDKDMRDREDARDHSAKRRHLTDLWILGGLVAVAALAGSIVQSCATLEAARLTQPPVLATPITPQSTPNNATVQPTMAP